LDVSVEVFTKIQPSQDETLESFKVKIWRSLDGSLERILNRLNFSKTMTGRISLNPSTHAHTHSASRSSL